MGRDEAIEAIETSKKLIMEKRYNDARDCIKLAMELYPDLGNGFEMLVISETLYYGYIHHPNFIGFDCYSVLHLPPSSTEAEVKNRFEDLSKDVTHLIRTDFPGVIDALSLLILANVVLCDKPIRDVFDQRRKACVQFDWPPSSPKKKTITTSSIRREGYLDWKPPIYRVDITKSSPSKKQRRDDDNHSLFQDLRILMNKVFDEMPHRPHFAPLEKYSEQVREGMILGLDMAFIKLSKEIQSLVYSPEILQKLEGFNSQFSQLEEMGYNVEKLKEGLHTLQRIVEREVASRAAAEIYENEVRNEELKVHSLRLRIIELEDQISGSEVLIANRKSKIAALKKDSSDAVAEFATMMKSLWK